MEKHILINRLSAGLRVINVEPTMLLYRGICNYETLLGIRVLETSQYIIGLTIEYDDCPIIPCWESNKYSQDNLNNMTNKFIKAFIEEVKE